MTPATGGPPPAHPAGTSAGIPAGSGPEAAPAAAPDRARIVRMDALRGFALLGILLVNITYLASAYHGTGLEDPGFDSALDTGVRYATAILFEAKFFLLFSFLFGYSFTLQLNSAERAAARFTPRFLRRLTALFVLGVCHAVLLFPGDILTTYAVLGLILLAVRRVQPRTAVRIAVALFVLTALGYALLALAQHLSGGGGLDPAATADRARAATEALRGDAGSVIGAHLRQLPDVVFLLVFFQAPAAFAAFLLGLAASRHGVMERLADHEQALRRIQWTGFPVGLAGGAVYAHASLEHPGSSYQLLALGVDVATAPLLAAAYAATVLRLVHPGRARRTAALLAPAGRMTLTNYLGQSLICALLFTGYGAALVGRVPPLPVVGIALALFLCQALASRRWLRRHPYGPVEWLLRAVTNATRPPWRKPDAP
ncbi:DUF418 domain-containing protein [Streptomyces jumonjinensis]|uniref:DUF418 domain-containing protein n=3 Tax=Streptomyces jumonjinensis TaxID=1945 RepID=A0A646KHB3_STRJU|nr:DUF418 domain-containing protein [Streptomyces jumonjinensis]